jgi:hypothetical protein
MKMSSSGSFVAFKNNSANYKEGSVSSTESNYSLQSEQYNPKQNAYAKFQRNKKAKRKGKMKRMRQNGNSQHIPKDPPKPKNGEVQPTNDSVDYVHQSLVEHLYPSSVLDQAKATLVSLNAETSVRVYLKFSKLLELLPFHFLLVLPLLRSLHKLCCRCEL